MAENIYDIAKQFGAIDPMDSLVVMPEGVNLPGGNLSGKNQELLRKSLIEKDVKRLQDNTEVLGQQKQVIDKLNRFVDLNKEAAIPTNWFTQIIPNITDRRQQMQAISASIAPGLRVEGSGTTSDRDIALYLASTVGLDKSLATNTNILADAQKQYDKSVAKQIFLDKYISKNDTLMGADQAWTKNQDKIMKILYGPSKTSALYYNEKRTTKGKDDLLIDRYINRKQD
jgi:hypothetical protein